MKTSRSTVSGRGSEPQQDVDTAAVDLRALASRLPRRRRRAGRQLRLAPLASFRRPTMRRTPACRKPAPALPGRPRERPLLDAWIRIDADGSVTVFTGKAELGQGIRTALIQIAAEELDRRSRRASSWSPPTRRRTPNEGYTAGSHSMQDSGTAIRNAAAQVREILLGAAAKRLRRRGGSASRRGRTASSCRDGRSAATASWSPASCCTSRRSRNRRFRDPASASR